MYSPSDKSLATDFHRKSFYMVFIFGADFEQVIPREFLQQVQIAEEPFGFRTLTGPSGHKWNVKLSIKGDDVYIEDGWERFYSDNSLTDYDFLVFRHAGNLNFDVQIFDKNGIEKKGEKDLM